MAHWFLGKIRFSKEVEPNVFKPYTEAYLLDAVSFTDAEARLYGLFGDNAADFQVTGLSPYKVQEVFFQEGAALKWFRVKTVTTTFDEKSQKEKKTSTFFLVNADNARQAYEQVENGLGRVEDYEITDVVLTPILEVVPYEADAQPAASLPEAIGAFEEPGPPQA